MLFHAHERMGTGIPATLADANKVHLGTYAAVKTPVKAPQQLHEFSTICQSLDFLKLGKPEKCADLLAGRAIAIEAAVTNKNNWELASKWEVRDQISTTLTGA